MKKWMALMLMAVTVLLCIPNTVYARLPYTTAYYDSNQSTWFRIQPIYTPAGAYSGEFGELVDLHVAADDKVYAADKKLNQIIVLNNDGTLLRTIGDKEGAGQLDSPEGVFVTPEGIIYVADSGNQRVAVFDTNGKFLREYTKPETPLMGSEHFVPVKLIVDRRGVMYIALNSSYQGLVRLNQEGEFMGYFGANKAEQTMLNWLKKLVLNKEQLAKEKATLPKPITNLSLDHDGFIYTATAGGEGKGAIRKLNAGGVDAYKNKTLENGHGIVDVAIDKDGFLYNVDLDSMRINLYDRTGDALFAFGLVDKETQQYGILGYPTGVGVDSHSAIWISDSRTKTVHKFVRTAFGKDVLQALALYQDGRYEDSKPDWDAVYARNDMYNGTFQGLGKVYLHEENNDQALEFMKTAYDTDGYSKAFWQIRLEWLQKHFVTLVISLIGLGLLFHFGVKGIRATLRKHSLPASWKQPLTDLRNFWYVMFHPYEGFYRMKEARVSPWITLVLLVAVLGVKLARIYWTGFLFHPVDLAEINLRNELGLFILPWVTWIIANYLVCSIKDGEGRLREVFQGSTYALAPYLFFSIPLLILTNIVTLDEKVIVSAISSVMTLWLLVMLIVMTQVIHNFDFMETIKNSAITVFAIGTIWLFGFIIFGLSYNLYDFFYELYKEVNFYH
ncbi:MAG: YIP1 family protein [Gorillibacterium sp.]|nr:YIP1 family protein [Gorillibacterium sp.]